MKRMKEERRKNKGKVNNCVQDNNLVIRKEISVDSIDLF